MSALLLCTVASAQSPPAVQELGGLQIFPTRVVLEGRTRGAALTLNNSGTKTVTYRISFVEMKMTENGMLIEVPESDPSVRAAAPFIRFSPKQVTLEPNVAQTVRLQLRKPADLAAGEYRSHILFRAIPEVPSDGSRSDAGMTAIGVQLNAVYGVSIPIIVRHADTSAKVTLANPALEAASAAQRSLSLTIQREGNQSVIGDLVATGPTGARLAERKSVAVYVPNGAVTARLPLSPEAKLLPGKIRIAYTDPAGATIAAAELVVP